MLEQELDSADCPSPTSTQQSSPRMSIREGAAFVLVNSHDPKHLREQFEPDYSGGYGWECIEAGPRVWRIHIAKVASTALPQVLISTAADPVEPTAPSWRRRARRRQPTQPPEGPG